MHWILYLYRVEYFPLDIFDELDVIDGGNEDRRSGEEKQEHKQHCGSEEKEYMQFTSFNSYTLTKSAINFATLSLQILMFDISADWPKKAKFVLAYIS